MNVMVVGGSGLASRPALEVERGVHLVDPPGDGVLAGESEIEGIAAAIRAFEALLGRTSVDRVVLVGASDLALAAVLVAAKMRIPVAAVAPNPADEGSGDLNRRLIEQLADAVLADDAAGLASWVKAPRPAAPSRDEH